MYQNLNFSSRKCTIIALTKTDLSSLHEDFDELQFSRENKIKLIRDKICKFYSNMIVTNVLLASPEEFNVEVQYKNTYGLAK